MIRHPRPDGQCRGATTVTRARRGRLAQNADMVPRRRHSRGAAVALVLLGHAAVIWMLLHLGVRLDLAPEEGVPIRITFLKPPQRVPVLGPSRIPTLLYTPSIDLSPNVPTIPLPAIETPPPSVVSTENVIAEATSTSGAAGKAGAAGGPVPLQRGVAVYPAASIRNREEGSVLMAARVDDSGRVVEVRVSRSSGHKRLDDSAEKAMRNWRFAPVAKGTRPSNGWTVLEMHFNLHPYQYSRIAEAPLSRPRLDEVRAGLEDIPTPTAAATLLRFLADVSSGTVQGEPAGAREPVLASLRTAMEGWGPALGIRFTNGSGNVEWDRYAIKTQYREIADSSIIEVRWDSYEIRHEKLNSLWRIAIDRQGRLWSIQGGPARPGQ